MLISDGDSSAVSRNAITNSDYTRMALSITSTSANVYFVDVVFAMEYENANDVASCKVTRDFGGDYCDPSEYEQGVFININAVREDPTFFESVFDDVIDAFIPNEATSRECNYDFDGDGTLVTRTFANEQ